MTDPPNFRRKILDACRWCCYFQIRVINRAFQTLKICKKYEFVVHGDEFKHICDDYFPAIHPIKVP